MSVKLRNKEFTACKVLESISTLDYKQQYKMCYDFYDEIKYPQFDENKHCLKFDEIYESINPDWLEEEKDKIEQCVEVMGEALKDIEKYDPETFQKIVTQIK